MHSYIAKCLQPHVYTSIYIPLYTLVYVVYVSVVWREGVCIEKPQAKLRVVGNTNRAAYKAEGQETHYL